MTAITYMKHNIYAESRCRINQEFAGLVGKVYTPTNVVGYLCESGLTADVLSSLTLRTETTAPLDILDGDRHDQCFGYFDRWGQP